MSRAGDPTIAPGVANATNTTSDGLTPISVVDDVIVVSIWTLITVYGLIANALILIGIAKNAAMRQSTSYWLIINLAVCDEAMLVITITHLIPATAFHDAYLIVDTLRNEVAIFVYDCFWYTGVIGLAVMSLNRVASIMYPMTYTRMFSPVNTLYMIGINYLLGILVSLPSLFECCLMQWNHRDYITSYKHPDTAYFIVDVLVNTMSTLVMILCYIAIIVRVRQSRLTMNQHIQKSALSLTSVATPPSLKASSTTSGRGGKSLFESVKYSKVKTISVPSKSMEESSSAPSGLDEVEAQPTRKDDTSCSGALSIGSLKSLPQDSTTRSRRPKVGANSVSNREIRLFIQFFVVSVVFVSTFVMWQLFLQVLPTPQDPSHAKWVYALLTALFFINNGTNPTVYLIFNTALRHEIRDFFQQSCCRCTYEGETTIESTIRVYKQAAKRRTQKKRVVALQTTRTTVVVTRTDSDPMDHVTAHNMNNGYGHADHFLAEMCPVRNDENSAISISYNSDIVYEV